MLTMLWRKAEASTQISVEPFYQSLLWGYNFVDLIPWIVPIPRVRIWVTRKGSLWPGSVIPQSRSWVTSGKRRSSSPRARPSVMATRYPIAGKSGEKNTPLSTIGIRHQDPQYRGRSFLVESREETTVGEDFS